MNHSECFGDKASPQAPEGCDPTDPVEGASSGPGESYPAGWWHCTIHLNPETGEMHSDGDHRVRHWLEARLKKEK